MHPFSILLLLFLLIPLVEIYLLIKVGGIIGALPTVFLVVFTALLGAWLLRLQGFSTLRRIQDTLAQGGLPALELLEGAVLLVAGALLLTPGFFTDTIGFLLLVPSLRKMLLLWLMRRFFQLPPQQPPPFHDSAHRHHPEVIEGEYKREDE